MKKAILIIDVPDGCEECQLMYKEFENGFGWVRHCTGSKKSDFYEDAIENHCPLKPMPTKKPINKSLYYDGYENIIQSALARGYNACIDEILGEENE